jgi:drug/metabolite transporter (DMT)-like permease
MVCALGSAVMWAVTSLLVRSLSPHFTSVGINALRSAVGGTLLVGYVLLEGGVQPFLDVSPAAFTLMTLSIVAAIGVGDTLFFESTRTLGLGRAMTIATSYPVLAAVLAAGFLDEPLTLPIVAGTLMTLGGLVLIVMTKADATAGRRPWPGIGAAAPASVGWAVRHGVGTIAERHGFAGALPRVGGLGALRGPHMSGRAAPSSRSGRAAVTCLRASRSSAH